jgi:hypothetical protein
MLTGDIEERKEDFRSSHRLEASVFGDVLEEDDVLSDLGVYPG